MRSSWRVFATVLLFLPLTLPGGAQTQLAKLTASDGESGDSFGGVVAISGNTIVVANFGGYAGIGTAYVFVKPLGGWGDMTQTAMLTPSDGAAGDDFGSVVAIDGNTVIVGAAGGSNFNGAAYVFVEPASQTNPFRWIPV